MSDPIFDVERRKKMSFDMEMEEWSDDQEIMSIEHKKKPIYGVQFHPESILTDHGKLIIKNFLNIV